MLEERQRHVKDTNDKKKIRETKSEKDRPPPIMPKKLLLFAFEFTSSNSHQKKIACSRLSAWKDDERGGGGRRAGSGRLFFLVLISRGALFALHRPKPRGVNERRDRRERKNWWSSRVVQREVALKFITTTTTTTTTARSKRVTTTRCCHYPC